MNAVRGLLQHALDRYCARSKARCAQRACAAIVRLAERAHPIGSNHYTAGGWILVIKDGWVRTLFRPDSLASRALVRSASRNQHRPERST